MASSAAAIIAPRVFCMAVDVVDIVIVWPNFAGVIVADITGVWGADVGHVALMADRSHWLVGDHRYGIQLLHIQQPIAVKGVA